MQYTLNQIYDHLHSKVYEIVGVFNTFFGESFVDAQYDKSLKQALYTDLCGSLEGYDAMPEDKTYDIADSLMKNFERKHQDTRATIYVWWPSVTVTNEYSHSVDIQDLYAKVEVSLSGKIPYECIGFTLNRATYTKVQFLSDYLHSHIHGIPRGNFEEFLQPCLGRGPIKGTINSLKMDFDITFWMLFCQELAMYVTVESLQGGPWRRLEQIGTNQTSWYNEYELAIGEKYLFCNTFSDAVLKNFILYYLQKGHLSLGYREGFFVPGQPFYDYIIDVSNTFIDFYNTNLKTNKNRLDMCFTSGLLNTVTIRNGMFYHPRNERRSYNLDEYRGKHILTFKGNDIRLSIIDGEETEEISSTTLLNFHVAMYILSNILQIINFRYKNEHNNSIRESSNSPSTYKKVIYV